MERNSLQGNPDWYKDRLFHFTSSELYKLLSEPKLKADKEVGELSQTAKSYVLDKVSEYITNGTCLEYREINSKEVKWGQYYELEARHVYEQRKHYFVDDCGFYEYNEYFGGSPDGVVENDGFIEIKCPYNSSRHVENILMKNVDDFKKVRPEYYAQIQGNFIATGRQWCDFISYDPRVQNPLFEIKILRVFPDTNFIENCLIKLKKAHEYKQSVMSKVIRLQTT